jgi:hypothetical protein
MKFDANIFPRGRSLRGRLSAFSDDRAPFGYLIDHREFAPEQFCLKGKSNMSYVTYRIVEYDGGWAYKVGDVFSETFPSRESAQKAEGSIPFTRSTLSL